MNMPHDAAVKDSSLRHAVAQTRDVLVATGTLSRAAPLSAARLLIHSAGFAGASSGFLESMLQRLRALFFDVPRPVERAPLSLQIDDLQGRRVLDIDHPGPMIELSLPGGTYQVTAQLGKVRRGYTLTLDHGATFDLHLCLVADRP
jgi:hypothetical protein